MAHFLRHAYGLLCHHLARLLSPVCLNINEATAPPRPPYPRPSPRTVFLLSRRPVTSSTHEGDLPDARRWQLVSKEKPGALHLLRVSSESCQRLGVERPLRPRHGRHTPFGSGRERVRGRGGRGCRLGDPSAEGGSNAFLQKFEQKPRGGGGPVDVLLSSPCHRLFPLGGSMRRNLC